LCDRIAILHQGAIRASGTMTELRAEAAAGAAGLEEIFLKLTGSENVSEIIASLRTPGAA
ncbi:MAG: ABC transporter ATP-binding protein, partial [Longimicrobiales bacterium]